MTGWGHANTIRHRSQLGIQQHKRPLVEAHAPPSIARRPNSQKSALLSATVLLLYNLQTSNGLSVAFF